MLIDTTDLEYLNVRRAKSTRDHEVVQLGAPVLHAIACRLLHELSGGEATTLFYLVGVTLCQGQRAREITLKELEKGIHDSDYGREDRGTGLSKNTIRLALKGLSDRNILTVYRKRESDGSEHRPRIYEIDFTGLLPSDGQMPSNTLQRLLKRGSETATPPTKNCPLLHTSNIVTSSVIKGDTSISSLAVSSLPGETVDKGVSDMGFVGKKKTAGPSLSSYSSASDAVAGIKAAHETKRAASVAKAGTSPALLSRQEMQAVFDTHCAAANLGYRLMVTQREHGFLRKRLAENSPKDFPDFVRWSITYWPTLSAQNRTATRKDLSVRVVRKALPEAPHFHTFVYWYPYFFRAYQNYLAGTTWESNKDAERTEAEAVIRSLKSRVVEAERNVSTLRRRAHVAGPVQMLPAKPARPAHRHRDDDLLAPIDLPDWDTQNQPARRK